MSEHTLEVHAATWEGASREAPREILLANLEDAIDLASDQDGLTWLTDHGKRIAAIMPVNVAEQYLADLREVLSTSVGCPDQPERVRGS